MTDDEMPCLQRCLALAEEALAAGDEPFGSVLVDRNGTVLAEDRNRVGSGDSTMHPEFELARWAARNMSMEERFAATVYTSGEHCPMCSAAHGWVGLGRIVYIASSRQLRGWLDEMDVPAPPVNTLAVEDVAPGVRVEGPVPELESAIHALHRRNHRYCGNS